MGACFVAGANVGYRSIMLLFVLPGLLDLKFGVLSHGLKLILTATLWTVLFLLWKEFFRHRVDAVFGGFDRADWPHLGYFVFRELAWWWVFAVFMAFVGLFLWQSPLVGRSGLGGAESLPPKPNGARFSAVT